jgi:integrase
LTVAAKAGLRLGELLGLEWPDCTLTKGAGVIEVRRQWTRLRETAPPKAGSRRSVPISDELVRMLLELKMRSVDKTGPVFASRTGSRLSHRNVERRGFDAGGLHPALQRRGRRRARAGGDERLVGSKSGSKGDRPARTAKTRSEENPPFAAGFLMGGAGIEPATSCL